MRIQLCGENPLQRHELQADYAHDVSALVLDARNLRWAGPLELAAMVSTGTAAAQQGLDVALLLPFDETSTRISRGWMSLSTSLQWPRSTELPSSRLAKIVPAP